MQNFIIVVVMLALIGVGVLLISLLNGQHDERIAAFDYGRYARFLPGAHTRSGLPTVTEETDVTEGSRRRSGRRRYGSSAPGDRK